MGSFLYRAGKRRRSARHDAKTVVAHWRRLWRAGGVLGAVAAAVSVCGWTGGRGASGQTPPKEDHVVADWAAIRAGRRACRMLSAIGRNLDLDVRCGG